MFNFLLINTVHFADQHIHQMVSIFSETSTKPIRTNLKKATNGLEQHLNRHVCSRYD